MSEVKERILQKADELFRSYGIKSVTMDELASQMGISKKTIYQFFADKDDLVENMMKTRMEMSRNDNILCAARSENAIHEIFLALDTMQEMFASMNPSILNDLEKYHPGGYAIFRDFKNDFLYNSIKGNIERGISEGLYREDVHVEILSRFRVSTLAISMAKGVFADNRFSLLEIEVQVLMNFLYGLVTAKGYKLIEKYKQRTLKENG